MRALLAHNLLHGAHVRAWGQLFQHQCAVPTRILLRPCALQVEKPSQLLALLLPQHLIAHTSDIQHARCISHGMYRLTLDVPYRFLVRPAFERAVHAVDLVAETQQRVYHDKGAGVILLTPSCLDERWQQHTVPISQINKQSLFWRPAQRGLKEATNYAHFMGSVYQAGVDRSLIELLLDIALIATTNRLKWIAETSFQLARDEAWAIHLQCANDEYTRDGDYWYAQWDRYALRMDTTGTLTFYRYPNRNALTQPPNEVARWHSGVASPVRAGLTVAALPLPPLGILVLTIVSGGASLTQATTSSTTRQLVSSKLIPLMEDAEDIGTPESPLYSLCQQSSLRLAVNIMYNPIVAFERVRYASSGTLTEKPFEVPLINPQVPQATPIVAYTHRQSASVAFQCESGGDWVAWDTPQEPTRARSVLTLTTDNAIYTPIVVGYFMRCEPLIEERSTMPVMAERVLELELTKDEYAREEGYAEVLLESDTLRTIARRGDTTYRLEYRENATSSWQTLSEGIAQVESIQLLYPRVSGAPYRARLALRGMWSRFTEVYQLASTAFDNVPLGEAFNKLLEGCGFERIANPPAALQAIRMPAAPQGDTSAGWRYAPRAGQSGEEILRTLLLIATATGSEWRLRWDYATGKWLLEQKPDGLPEWTLESEGSVDPATRQYRYRELELQPKPPEANLIYVEGATAPSKEGERLVCVLVNTDSLDEPNSLDYLGRIKMLRVKAESFSEMSDVERLANRLYAAAARHCMDATVRVPLPQNFPQILLELLSPPRKVTVRVQSTPLLIAYIKRATLSASAGDGGRTELTLHLSTRYESDPRD